MQSLFTSTSLSSHPYLVSTTLISMKFPPPSEAAGRERGRAEGDADGEGTALGQGMLSRKGCSWGGEVLVNKWVPEFKLEMRN